MLAGTLIAWAGENVPVGYLLCDGSSVLQTDWPDLYAALGTAWGSEDSAHFNLPNFTGRFPQGANPAGGDFATQGGNEQVSLAASNLPPHTHLSGLGSAASTGSCIGGNGARANDLYTGNGPGITAPFSILPPYTRVW